MTLKELIMKVSFDELLPYLKEYEKKHLDDIYSFREAYDILRNMEPNKDYKGQVTMITATRKDGTLIMQINFLDDDVWENELAKEFVFPNGMPLCMEEFAMRCLWEITYWGFSPCEVDATEVQMFGLKELKNKYEVALDNLEESFWKHQAPRRLRSKGQDDELYTSIDFPLNKNDGRKNRSKRKREYRQDRRQEYLEKMAARENLVRMLTADGSIFKRADVDFLLNIAYGTRYDYTSVTKDTGSRLAYILESMTKYQQVDLSKYNGAIVFIRYSAHYPLDTVDLDNFKKAVRKHLTYKEIIFGTKEKDRDDKDVRVTLMLIKQS